MEGSPLFPKGLNAPIHMLPEDNPPPQEGSLKLEPKDYWLYYQY
jgi:hypothetical protein